MKHLSILTLTGLLLPAAALSAQGAVAASLSTADVVGVFANQQTDLARAGTAIPTGLRLVAQDGRQAASISTATPADPRGGAGASFGWEGMASDAAAGTLAGNPPTAGAQAYELHLVARQAVQGQIVIGFDGRASNARAGASVRVGRVVKTFDAASGAGRDSIPNLTVDSTGLTVRVEIAGGARAGAGERAGYACRLVVGFVADGGASCTVTPHTRSCPEGGALTGRAAINGRAIELGLQLAGALPDAIGLTIASPASGTFPIGSSNCVFFDRPMLIATFNTDANGDAASRLRFPAMQGAIYLQQATLLVSPRGLRLGTSNTVEVACR